MKLRSAIQRVFDVTITLPLTIALLPLFAVIAVLVRLSLGSPILFRQARPGKHGKTFVLYKFRTMRDAVDRDGKPLSDSERLAWFGRMLRATSLDELPELFNVLRGEMSLVGPRPLLIEYLPLYTPEQMRRHDVRPGITGWAQVNGRNAISWEKKFELDIWYVDHQSLPLDIWILMLTLWRVVRRDGISHPEHATMPHFRGSVNPVSETRQQSRVVMH